MSTKTSYELPGDELYAIAGSDGSLTAKIAALRAASASAQSAARLAGEQKAAAYAQKRAAKAADYAADNAAAQRDFRRADNPYGSRAEDLWSAGLADSGYAGLTRRQAAADFADALSDNAADYGPALDELSLKITRARESGDAKALQKAADYALRIAVALASASSSSAKSTASATAETASAKPAAATTAAGADGFFGIGDGSSYPFDAELANAGTAAQSLAAALSDYAGGDEDYLRRKITERVRAGGLTDYDISALYNYFNLA